MARHFIRMFVVSACCVTTLVGVARAQETINYASVSGRVTDPQGAVVPGAAGQRPADDTNVAAETVTDSEGRFRFPYLKVGPYEVKVHLRRIQRRHPHADPDDRLGVRPADRAVGRTVSTRASPSPAKPTVLETARSQIAGTVPQAEVQSLPMNGRNFLDLALLIPGVSPTNVGSTQLFAETSAVPGQGISIASQRNLSNSFIVDGLSANDDAAGLSGIPYGVDAVEQFQVVTSGGQAELGRALGGYVNVVTKSGTNAAARHGCTTSSATTTSTRRTRCPARSCRWTSSSIGGSLGGPIVRNRTFYFANVEQRLLDQTGLVTILPQNAPIINARLTAVGYPGAPVTHRRLSESGAQRQPPRESRSPGQRLRSVHGAVQPLSRHVRQLARRRALNAPSASAGLDNVDHSLAFGNTWTLSPKTVNETRAQFAYGDLKAPPTDPIGPAVSIAGVASFGTLSGSPTRRDEHDVPGRRQPLASGRRARAARRRGLRVQRRHHHLSRGRLAAAMRSRRSPTSSPAPTAGSPRRSATRSSRRPIRTSACTRRTSGGSASGLTLNLGLRYDLQFLRADRHRHEQRVAARRVRLVAVGVARPASFAAVPACSSTACRCAPSPTPSCRPGTPPTSTSCISRACRESFPRRTAPRRFPNILPARLLTTTLVDFTTMDRTPAERVLEAGQRRSGAIARQRAVRSASATSTSAARTC